MPVINATKSRCLVGGIGLLCLIQVLLGLHQRLLTALCFSVAIGLWAFLVRSTEGSDSKALTSKFLVFAVVAIGVVMVLVPPATSKDFNSYALYGRMMAEYGASPYSNVPWTFAGDPWFEATSFYWADSPSVYGWLFNGVSWLVMEMAGTSVDLARAGFAAVTLAGFLLTTWLLARRFGATKAVVLFGLNPLVLTFGLNDLHCDVLVGMFVVAAALSLAKRNFVWAVLGGVLLAAAVGVKVSALPAVGGAGLWLLFSRQLRSFFSFSASFIVTSFAGVVAAGGLAALAPISEAAGRQTRFSLWNPVASFVSRWTTDAPPTLGAADEIVGVAASLSVVVAGLLLIWRYRNETTPFLAIAAGLVAYQVLGAYVLSWYALWALPVLTAVYRSKLAFVCMFHGAWIALAYLSGWLGLVAASFAALAYLASRRLGRQREFLRTPLPTASKH